MRPASSPTLVIGRRINPYEYRCKYYSGSVVLSRELYAARVRAPVVTPYLVFDLFVGGEARDVDLDLGVVHEEVLARGTNQEAVTLLRIKPLDAAPLARQLLRCVLGPTVGRSGGPHGAVLAA